MLDETDIRQLLAQVARRERSVDDAFESLRTLPFEQVDGFACIDHHRALRCGCSEVIYCAGKTPAQVAAVAAALARKSAAILGTRASREHFVAAADAVPALQYDEPARCIWTEPEPRRRRLDGVLLLAAGTSDFPVAEEANRTLHFLGQAPQKLYDVGVAGLHRLLAHREAMARANVIIVVAGMEGALPSVVAGLVSAPVIAVPTSVGYGASFGGLAALLGMLNSCASGVGVVNIDNGFGAARLAASINSRIHGATNS
jgi:NCAIR mutase (PurE)-related protein